MFITLNNIGGLMAFNPVPINRENLTFCGIKFPDVETLNKTANAIGSNMFEGFEPTSKSVEIIRDYVMDKITIPELIQIVKEKLYV
jgi:hypothetical protein